MALFSALQVGGGDPHAATLCWICASNVDAAVQQWSSALDNGGSTVNALQVRRSSSLPETCTMAGAEAVKADVVLSVGSVLS